MFVFHCKDSISAKAKFASVVKDSDNWLFLGTKTVLL